MLKDKKLLTIFQDHKVNIKEYSDYFNDILSIKKIIGDQNCIIEVNGDILIKNYIGCFSTKRISIQVIPKIYDEELLNSPNEIKKSLNLVYKLLEWSDYFSFVKFNASRIISNTDSFLEIIISLFIDEFLIIHGRNNYREYRDIESEEIFLKGKILFNKSNDYNPTKSLRKFIQYDELSINNLINRIIKTTIFKLIGFTRKEYNIKKLRLGLLYLEEVDFINLNSGLFKKIYFNNINREYKPIIQFAEMFFSSHQFELKAGTNETLAFSIQLNLLFENFVLKVLQNIYVGKYEVAYQKKRYLAEDNLNNPKFQVKPDFMIVDTSKNTIMILDTKFKNPYPKTDKIGIKSSDIYQMCAYSICFNCNSIVLIYPVFKGCEKLENTCFNINIESKKLKINIVQIDLFVDDFDSICKNFKNQLENI